METSVKQRESFWMQALEPSEMQAVCGGFLPSTDVSGMPDRTVMCGTMWLLERMFPRPR